MIDMTMTHMPRTRTRTAGALATPGRSAGDVARSMMPENVTMARPPRVHPVAAWRRARATIFVKAGCLRLSPGVS